MGFLDFSTRCESARGSLRFSPHVLNASSSRCSSTLRAWLGEGAAAASIVALGTLGQLPVHVAALEAGLDVSFTPSARTLLSARGARDRTDASELVLTAIGDHVARRNVATPIGRGGSVQQAAFDAAEVLCREDGGVARDQQRRRLLEPQPQNEVVHPTIAENARWKWRR
jgi:hypothetical protein